MPWYLWLLAIFVVAALLVVFLLIFALVEELTEPWRERRRTRIKSPSTGTFVEDPFVGDPRYENPLHVIGGSAGPFPPGDES